MASAEDVPVDKGVVMVVVPMAVAFWGGPVRVTTAVSDLVSETVRVMADSMDSVVTVWALSLEGTVTVTVTVSASHSELDEVPTVWVKTPLTTRVVLVLKELLDCISQGIDGRKRYKLTRYPREHR